MNCVERFRVMVQETNDSVSNDDNEDDDNGNNDNCEDNDNGDNNDDSENDNNYGNPLALNIEEDLGSKGRQ